MNQKIQKLSAVRKVPETIRFRHSGDTVGKTSHELYEVR